MRTLLIVPVLLLATAGWADAQERDPDPRRTARLRQKLERKLASPFLELQPWELDYDKAKAAARKRKLPIFAYFSWSYAPCPTCKQFEDVLFRDPSLAELSKSAVLFAQFESRIPGRKYDDLLRALGRIEAPALLMLDDEGNVLNEVAQGRPRLGWRINDFVAAATTARVYMDLKLKKNKTKEERFELLKLQIDYDAIDPDDAHTERKALTLDPELDKIVANVIERVRKTRIDRKILGAYNSMRFRSKADFEQRAPELGEVYWKWYQQGKRPVGEDAQKPFYAFLIHYGVGAENAKAARAGLDGFREHFPHQRDWLDQQERRISSLEERLRAKPKPKQEPAKDEAPQPEPPKGPAKQPAPPK